MPFGRKIQTSKRPARSGLKTNFLHMLWKTDADQSASYPGKEKCAKLQDKEKPMGEKDITEKILEDHNDVFADIINCTITE